MLRWGGLYGTSGLFGERLQLRLYLDKHESKDSHVLKLAVAFDC